MHPVSAAVSKESRIAVFLNVALFIGVCLFICDVASFIYCMLYNIAMRHKPAFTLGSCNVRFTGS